MTRPTPIDSYIKVCRDEYYTDVHHELVISDFVGNTTAFEFEDASEDIAALKSELAAAQEALKAAEARAEEYRKDAERLDSVASEYFKIEPFAMSTWAGDADVGWCITKFYMAKPCERVVAEVFRDDPRAAIDAAMKESK